MFEKLSLRLVVPVIALFTWLTSSRWALTPMITKYLHPIELFWFRWPHILTNGTQEYRGKEPMVQGGETVVRDTAI